MKQTLIQRLRLLVTKFRVSRIKGLTDKNASTLGGIHTGSTSVNQPTTSSTDGVNQEVEERHEHKYCSNNHNCGLAWIGGIVKYRVNNPACDVIVHTIEDGIDDAAHKQQVDVVHRHHYARGEDINQSDKSSYHMYMIVEDRISVWIACGQQTPVEYHDTHFQWDSQYKQNPLRFLVPSHTVLGPPHHYRLQMVCQVNFRLPPPMSCAPNPECHLHRACGSSYDQIDHPDDEPPDCQGSKKFCILRHCEHGDDPPKEVRSSQPAQENVDNLPPVVRQPL